MAKKKKHPPVKHSTYERSDKHAHRKNRRNKRTAKTVATKTNAKSGRLCFRRRRFPLA